MLEVTTLAVDKIKETLQEEGSSDAALRVIALPGNDGGVQYMLTLEQDEQDDDTPLDRGGLKFLVDADSAPYLEKATIDFVEELARVGFTITNPDYPAVSGCGSGCGCGSSGGGCGTSGCGCGASH